MIKLAISGKAGSGKSTLQNMFISNISGEAVTAALADPIKEIIMIMFPKTKCDILYGKSENRYAKVPNASLNLEPITYRELLQYLGTEVGRNLNPNIWIDVLDYKKNKALSENKAMFIVSDVRFRNEFDHVKQNDYITIRIKRNIDNNMDHISESEQDEILDKEFDYVIYNICSKDDLEDQVKSILKEIEH